MKRFLITFFLLLATSANAAFIERNIEITPSVEQFFDDGRYGSGVFWRPSFSLTPFSMNGAGDTIELNLSLAGGYRINVIAGSVEQEAAAGFVLSSDSYLNTHYDYYWEFQDVQGDVYQTSYSGTSYSQGPGFGVNINPIDLTDTFFSFGGVKLILTLNDDPRLKGFPATFDSGFIAIQSQGSIIASSVPIPSSILLLCTGFIGVAGIRKLQHTVISYFSLRSPTCLDRMT